MKHQIDGSDALIVIDVQKDFCLGGALPVPQGDKVVPTLNKYMRKFEEAGAKIYATRDWHPPKHKSFEAQGGPWPPHCIRESKGAEFHRDLSLPRDVTVVSKGTEASVEGYSGFDETDLEKMLKEDGVERVFVGGLATDYCVKKTILDALEQGFKTILLTDATRGVNAEPNDAERAIREMVDAGAKRATLSDIE